MRSRRLLIALLAALLLVGLGLAGASALRLYRRQGRPPPPPRQSDVSQIAGWMTMGYVARSFRVPPEVVSAATGVPFEGNERRPLDDLAAQTGRDGDELVVAVRSAVGQHRAQSPPKPGKPEGAPQPRGPP